ncbi:YdeI/OmpD-associated family protein [Paenibacillus solisilvae]|uniref:YdeI/OmpD-associated family protein n=1 Tax=Paenibacillus solisilvae TaxID=2486751 RepID=A0ABW0VWF0_9BACL
MKTYTFQAQILKHPDMDAAYIQFPYNVEEEFGAKGQVKVKAVFDGTAEYRGSLAKMGLDCHCLGVTKKVRGQLGKKPGEWVQVRLSQDTEPRIVEVPEDLLNELRHHKIESVFQQLSFTKKQEIVQSIVSSKKEETRLKRINDALTNLSKMEVK